MRWPLGIIEFTFWEGNRTVALNDLTTPTLCMFSILVSFLDPFPPQFRAISNLPLTIKNR